MRRHILELADCSQGGKAECFHSLEILNPVDSRTEVGPNHPFCSGLALKATTVGPVPHPELYRETLPRMREKEARTIPDEGLYR